ncbi:MAG: single-stranded DNA-binding protein [Mangrovibacterium sp.]
MSINKVILIGHVGQDPEVRYLDKDLAVANFSLATTERFTDKEGKRIENTDWHRVVAWRGLATVVEQYVKKGSKLYVEGKLRTHEWNDKEGNKRYTTEIYVETLEMLDSREKAANSPLAPTEIAKEVASPDLSRMEDDDLPF